jgi:hypothetical protein
LIKYDNKNYDVLIEINGGIHTKNPEQKQNNRMRYNQLRDFYNSKSVYKSNMIMIVFEADEFKYHKMDYFINTIIDTIMTGKEKYPDPFLFELP